MRRVLLVSAGCVALAGCGGAAHRTTTSTRSSSTPTTPVTSMDGSAQLEQDVRSAVAANNQLSVYVLWHNKMPAWASQSTGGPALSELRSSAATRRAQGIRVRLLSADYRVVGVQLNPSYATATATIQDSGHVLPYDPRTGRAVSFNEHARLELRRVDDSQRFIVWRVVSLP